MRGIGRFSDETREKIKAAAVEINYVPNKKAANLRSGKVSEVGLLIQDVSNPFNAELTSGVVRVLEQAEHLVYLLDADEDTTRQHRLVQSIIETGVCGLIWHPAVQTHSETIDLIKRADLVTTTALRPIENEGFDYVGVNDYQVSKEACSHLVENGHTQIGFLGGQTGAIESSTQFAGYAAALDAAGIKLNWDYCFPCHADKKSAFQGMSKLLKASPELTAVVCYNDVVAFGAYYSLLGTERIVGKDFALVGCDDIEDATLMTPSLSTVSVSPKTIGQNLAETLLKRLKQPRRKLQTIELEPSLIIRGSSGFRLI